MHPTNKATLTEKTKNSEQRKGEKNDVMLLLLGEEAATRSRTSSTPRRLEFRRRSREFRETTILRPFETRGTLVRHPRVVFGNAVVPRNASRSSRGCAHVLYTQSEASSSSSPREFRRISKTNIARPLLPSRSTFRFAHAGTGFHASIRRVARLRIFFSLSVLDVRLCFFYRREFFRSPFLFRGVECISFFFRDESARNFNFSPRFVCRK